MSSLGGSSAGRRKRNETMMNVMCAAARYLISSNNPIEASQNIPLIWIGVKQQNLMMEKAYAFDESQYVHEDGIPREDVEKLLSMQ